MRTLFKYINRHREHTLGAFEVTSTTDEVWDDGSSGFHYAIVRVKAEGYRRPNIIRSLKDSMRDPRCWCSHDCCGCVRRYASEVEHITGDLYGVKVSATCNI